MFNYCLGLYDFIIIVNYVRFIILHLTFSVTLPFWVLVITLQVSVYSGRPGQVIGLSGGRSLGRPRSILDCRDGCVMSVSYTHLDVYKRQNLIVQISSVHTGVWLWSAPRAIFKYEIFSQFRKNIDFFYF